MMGHMLNRGFYGGNWENMPDYMKDMMQSYYGGMGPFLQVERVLGVVKELSIIVLLVAAIRWLWMKGEK